MVRLPKETRIFVGHDYAPNGREALCEATVEDRLKDNIHFATAPSENVFRQIRDVRDATLPLPRLMLAALQVNRQGMRLPVPEANGRSYLKVPLDQFEPR